MLYKFPIRIPEGKRLTLSQPFRSKTPVDLSKALSIETTDHNGVDITCGTNEQTWGTECIWPFPWMGIVYGSVVNATFGATMAHAQIDTTDPETGVEYSLIYLHLSSVKQTKAPFDTKQLTYSEGDIIGKIGNNGSVTPHPTLARPLDGSHLHLGLGVKKPGELNYTMVNPLLYFDINDPYRTQFKFNKNLWLGMNNDDVKELQKRLGVFPQTGFFGTITSKKVVEYQKANNITPAVGFVGSITRSKLNA